MEKRFVSKAKILRSLVWILGLCPLTIYGWRLYNQDLGPQPADYLNKALGYWGLLLVVINLWIGFAVARIKPFPVKLRFLLRERRYLGVVSGVYLLIHFTMYLLKEGLEWEAVEAIVEKRYLFCGAVSLGIISLLLITSTDFAVKLLKFKNWKSLHRLIHVAFVFILVHVFSIEKADLIKYAFILIPLFLAQTLRFSFSFAKNRKVPFQPPHS